MMMALALLAGCSQTANVQPLVRHEPDAATMMMSVADDAAVAPSNPDAAAPVGTPDAGSICAAITEACAPNGCCTGTYCVVNVYTLEGGTCRAQVADGEACHGPEQCLTGACTDNVCGAPVCHAQGEPCYGLANPCCAGFFCDVDPNTYGMGFCVPPKAIGEACRDHVDCASGNCFDNACVERSAVSFARVYSEILVSAGCTNGYCHGTSAGDLSMRTVDVAYQALVRGAGCGDGIRVWPGNPTESLIWQKVAPNVAVCGNKMPPNGALTSAQLELLAAWIAAGAPM